MHRALLPLGLLLALAPDVAQAQNRGGEFEASCGFNEAAQLQREHLAKLRSGVLPRRAVPAVGPSRGQAISPAPTVTPGDIFPFEDTASVLLTNFSYSDLNALLVDASNAIMAAHGDSFDFVAFFVNFTPDHQIGAAFYELIENDVDGIGDVGAFAGEPLPTFNLRGDFGIGGNNIEGWIMMWEVTSWAGGSGSSANFTRLVLGQEFEHRFSLFLPPLIGGRSMQGDDSICGRSAHWNWQVDNQGSSMEVSDWTGSSPAVPSALGISFNTDIPGGVFSYTDLYLMGYVTPAEMDAGNSELRFMEGSDCSSDFNGTISSFTSADIIASAGPRVPDFASEDKAYRTGWVMLHLPGLAPSPSELSLAADILNQHSTDWDTSTLGRGTMDNTLPAVIAPGAPAFPRWAFAALAVFMLIGGGVAIRR